MKDPKAVIQSCCEAYANFSSYADSGSVKDTGEPQKGEITFKTVFERPTRFRFEWQDKRMKPEKIFSYVGVLWSDGTTHIINTPNRTETHPELSTVIASSTGISSSAAFIVPTLLFPNMFLEMDPWLISVKPTSIVEDSIEDRDCYLIKGTRKSSEDYSIWIDQEILCIRRILQLHRITVEDLDKMKAYMQEMIREGNFESHLIPEIKPFEYTSEHNYVDIRINETINSCDFEQRFTD